VPVTPFGTIGRSAVALKFTIELLREGAVIHRTVVDEIKPLRAKVAAGHLLSKWKHRGATVARILNPHGEEIFTLDG
jgi:hypothetical protein